MTVLSPALSLFKLDDFPGELSGPFSSVQKFSEYVSISISVITGCYVQGKGFGKYLQRPSKKGSGYMVPKHVAFAPEKMGTAPFCKKEDILNLRT